MYKRPIQILVILPSVASNVTTLFSWMMLLWSGRLVIVVTASSQPCLLWTEYEAAL